MAAATHASPSVNGVPVLYAAFASNQPVTDVVGSPAAVILTQILQLSDVCSQPLSKPVISLKSNVKRVVVSIAPNF